MCLEGLRKAMKNLSQDSGFLGQASTVSQKYILYYDSKGV
jgi:hypothetical protein